MRGKIMGRFTVVTKIPVRFSEVAATERWHGR